MRLARVAITHELLRDFLTKGYAVYGIECLEGLPEGAEFVCSYQGELGISYLVYSHDGFNEVEIGCDRDEIPTLNVVYKRYYGENLLEKVKESIAA